MVPLYGGLPVTLDAATGKKRAVFSKTKTELGLNAVATAKIILMAEVIVNGNKVFRTLAVNLVAGPNFRLTYDKNASTGGTVPMDVNFYLGTGTVAVMANTGVLVKSGAKFAGWNTQADGLGTNYAPRRTFAMGAADRTLFANWTTAPTFTVTYNGNGNTNGSVPFDANLYLPTDLVPALGNIYTLEKTGFVHGGWNTKADGTGTAITVVPVPSQTFVMPAENVTFYAKWN
ncbi:MAG: InlB B-repeat-containing protein [Bacteroidales bacterium]|nr:InlB B-repeat-containing protein [Bacteroidales bacterium]